MRPPSPAALSDSAERSADAWPLPTWYTNSSVLVLLPDLYHAAAAWPPLPSPPESSASDALAPSTRAGAPNSAAIRTVRPSPYAPSGSRALTSGGSNLSSSTTAPACAPRASATNSLPPGPAAMLTGGPVPPQAARPSSAANAPSAPNAWMRPLPVSATSTRPPGPIATPRGPSNCPSPAPAGSDALPAAARNVPFPRYSWTRPVVPSDTAIRPPGPAATPVMLENAWPPAPPPAPRPAPPNSSSLAPVVALSTRTVPSSDPTTSLPPGPAASASGSSPAPEPARSARTAPSVSITVRLPSAASAGLRATTVPSGRTAIWSTDPSQPAASMARRAAAPSPLPTTSMRPSSTSVAYIPPGPTATCPGALLLALPTSSACSRTGT